MHAGGLGFDSQLVQTTLFDDIITQYIIPDFSTFFVNLFVRQMSCYELILMIYSIFILLNLHIYFIIFALSSLCLRAQHHTTFCVARNKNTC